MTNITDIDETRLDTLLERWNQHQDLRRSGATVATLVASASSLASARKDLYQVG